MTTLVNKGFEGARWYDPTVGRWLSEDPNPEGALADGPNPYVYCHNSPANGVDPSGLWVEGEVRPGDSDNGYNGLGDWPADDFWKIVKPQFPNPGSGPGRPVFEQGCIGLAMMRLGWPTDKYIKLPGEPVSPATPTRVPGALAFTSEELARAELAILEKKTGKKYMLIAMQINIDPSKWKGDNPDQYNPLKIVTPADGEYNFATWHNCEGGGYWEYMNNAYNVPGKGPPTVSHKPKLPPVTEYKYTIWLVVPVNSG